MHIILTTKLEIKKIFFLILIAICSIAAFLYIYNSNLGVFLGNNKKLPIYSVDTNSKSIAITFDSSWGKDNTSKILDILDKNNVKATFFLIGRWCEDYPEETKEIAKRGNEIGNHSYRHPDMTKMSKSEIVKDITMADDEIFKLTGKKVELFRCPSGAYNNSVIEAVESTKHKCIQWDVDSVDWQERGAETEFNRVIKNVKPGSILLFHNNAKYTPQNLVKIIKKLKGEGYKFVKVSELLYKDNFHIDYNGKQIKNNY